jgi:hypothetical protein
MRAPVQCVVWVIACALAVGCGSDSNGSSPSTPTTPTTPSATTTTFQGTIAGANSQTGTLTVTVQAQVAVLAPSRFHLPFVATLHAQSTSVTASGSFRAARGATTSLTGTYDTTTRALSLTGGGYTFTGTASGATVNGTYTGPSGVAGSFSSRSTASGAVTVYCGNIYSSGNANQVTGVFNLVVSDASGAVSGTFYLLDAPFRNGPITGQLTGTSLSITYTDRVSGGSGTGTGTIQGGAVTGSSPAQSGGSNPFTGSTGRCQ